VNYAEIYAVVKQEMEIPSALLEHAAARILSALKERFPSITAANIELEKLNPPFGADIRSASVEITKRY
jgi:dihydroneopterin aldolase